MREALIGCLAAMLGQWLAKTRPPGSPPGRAFRFGLWLAVLLREKPAKWRGLWKPQNGRRLLGTGRALRD